MCGINAIYKRTSAPVERERLSLMTSLLAHRGPDGSGFALLNEGRVGLSHTRLSIIDLESGDQPLFNEDGTVCITFNGEIYDYKNHRAELERLGHKFRTHSDTEVLVHMYEEYGLEFLHKINGEFAFIIWDSRRKELIAAVDPFSVKPLHYSVLPSEILFSSEAKAILGLEGFERAVDPNFMVGPFFGAFPKGACFFKNVRSLPAGHFAIVRENGVLEERPYWTPSFRTEHGMTFEEAREGVRRGFERAVERRMVADVPVGTYLSGGLDSTLVCALMSERTEKLKSFNVGFGGTIYDESTLARRIAAHYGATFETFDCHDELMASNLTATLYHTEKPIVNGNSIGKFLLSKLVHDQNFKVVITGEGSDEIFGGYPYFKLEKIWRLNDKRKQKELWKRFQKIEARSEGVLWQKGNYWKKIKPLFGYPNVQQVRIEDSSDYADEFLHPRIWLESRYKTPSEYLSEEFSGYGLSKLDPFNASKILAYNGISSYIIPNLGDRMEMAHSIEGRTPFLDRDLVEFASTVPPEHFMDIENLREKHLLREAFRDKLPDFMWGEHKHPFSTANWFKLFQVKPGREILESSLSKKNIEDSGIFRYEMARFMKLVWPILPKGSAIWRKIDTSLGLIITTLMLHDLFIKSRPSPSVRLNPADRGWKNDRA